MRMAFLPRATQSNQAVLEQASAREIETLSGSSMFSVEMDQQQVAKLEKHKQVDYVEVDPPRYLLSETIPWGYTR